MKHTDIKKLFAESESFVGTAPVICGWVRTARDSKNVSFLEVNDGSCFRSLQLVIVPMVFTSIILAIGAIRDAATLGRISGKTFLWFFITTSVALVFAGVIALICYKAGAFSTVIEGIEASAGSTGSNPLNVILNIIPSNITATFTTNSGVLALVFLAIGTIFVLPSVYERTALPKRSLSEKATHDLRQAGQQITEAAFLLVFVFHDLGLILGG